MSGRRASAHVAIVLGSLVCLVSGGAQQPLTQEDVVRMFVQGVPEKELIRRIESLPGEYDLSEEMLEELKIAGIPGAVLEAMIRRQAEMEPLAEEAESAAGTVAPRLVLRLNPGWKPRDGKPLPTLITLDQVDPELSQRLGLQTSDLPITDLGIALLCRTADHVPDHWRSKSPLGRDFSGTPRHRMLVYLSGADTKPASKMRNTLSKLFMAPGYRDALADLNVLTLEVPERLTVEMEADVAHDLTLGVVVRIGERNYLTMSAEKNGLVLATEGDTTVTAELRSGSKNPLKAKVGFSDQP